MSRAITFGTFDLLHYGHLRLLARIAAISDFFMVGLATDSLVMAGGKSCPFYSYNIRREMLLHTRHVNEVVEHSGPVDAQGRVKVIQQKIKIIQNHQINKVVMGDDWQGEYDFLKDYCEVLYLPRTAGISTTQIKQQLSINYSP